MLFRFLLLTVTAFGINSGVLNAQSSSGPLIMIDPGHGGTAMVGSLRERCNSSSNNAVSPSGLKEKDLTLEFSRILRDELLLEANRSGPAITVGLTRDRDVNVSFIDRAAACNFATTACVVSIHFNAGGGGKATGSLALISDRKRNRNYELDYDFGKGLASACNAGVR
ncbi:N-acetylmuramoyl-L-alanine amidase [Verrucomicrobiales bacterium]|nr:N-acetylmuramoyl-L-alanine amidase [Verrucomicrobiales bacterium]